MTLSVVLKWFGFSTFFLLIVQFSKTSMCYCATPTLLFCCENWPSCRSLLSCDLSPLENRWTAKVISRHESPLPFSSLLAKHEKMQHPHCTYNWTMQTWSRHESIGHAKETLPKKRKTAHLSTANLKIPEDEDILIKIKDSHSCKNPSDLAELQ